MGHFVWLICLFVSFVSKRYAVCRKIDGDVILESKVYRSKINRIYGFYGRVYACTRWTCRSHGEKLVGEGLYLDWKLDKGPRMNLSRVHEDVEFHFYTVLGLRRTNKATRKSFTGAMAARSTPNAEVPGSNPG
mmetsp:Transcript_22648/g.34045  ORF Transcript_22648/g.34045 Transcript_22648/m.34045 type:complete len:133 (+) Transcript_22648:39-437(+)